MAIVPILRRPRYSRGSVLQWVQFNANVIAKSNAGKIPDIFLLDAKLRQELDQHPEILDLDRYVRDCRKFWERQNNRVLGRDTATLFIPGAYVALGKRMRARMVQLKLPADIVLWLEKDAQIREDFNNRMDVRHDYQLQRIADAAANPDCKELGDLEMKKYGFVPKPTDDDPFGAGDTEDDDANEIE